MTPEYPWYHLIADDTLEQGDFLFNCPVLLPYWDGYKSDLPEGDGYLIKARKTSYDVVIMSQSCDLENDKLDLVLVCPHWSIDVFEQNNYPNAGKKHKISLRNKIRRGELPAYHMLAASDIPNHEHDIRLVSFRQVLSLPIDFVKHLTTQESPRLHDTLACRAYCRLIVSTWAKHLLVFLCALGCPSPFHRSKNKASRKQKARNGQQKRACALCGTRSFV